MSCVPSCYPGTDRNNMVQTSGPNVNYPTPWDKLDSSDNMFDNAEILWTSVTSLNPLTKLDHAIAFASSGYYQCFADSTCDNMSVETKDPMDQLLNNAPASFEGALLRFTKEGTYYYICSRNNNFTNRSQKGQITVREKNRK